MRWRTILVVAVGLSAAPARAQQPAEPEFFDENVEPAQFLQRVPGSDAPVVPRAPGVDTPGSPGPVADPPPPVVRIQVRVPADAATGDNLKYLLTVRNESRADAHQVTVRNPVPADTTFDRADPPPDKGADPTKLVWSFGTLKGGESKTIELVLKPKGEPKEVRNLAYVRFEHGEAVTTKISRPGVKVTKLAPKEGVRDEPFAVRVVVENTGRVPAEKVRVVETADREAKFEAVTAGGLPTREREAAQMAWDLGTLAPGQRRVVEYRLTPGPGTGPRKDEATTDTVVSADGKVQEKTAATTRVLVPGLSVTLVGPLAGPDDPAPAAAPIGPGERAWYKVVVRNTGTLPAGNVRVTGTVPPDCRVDKMTNRGQVGRDAVGWSLGRLAPGEAWELRYALRTDRTARREVTATATADRGQKDTKTGAATVFQGTAAPTWETKLDPPDALAVGRQGTLSVRVRNTGAEAARGVKLTAELPAGVSFVRSTPDLRAVPLEFPAETIPAGGEKDYLVTYKAERAGPAVFKLKLTADALGERPVETTKSVLITGGK